jgi:exosortase
VASSPGEPPLGLARLRLDLGRRLTLSYLQAFSLIAAVAAVAGAFSYWTLLPLAESESPHAVILLVPLVGLVVLAIELAPAPRHGEETAANIGFALPLVVGFAALVLLLPARLSYFYWLYRFDLLALPIIVGIAVILLFGLPALWSTRSAFLILLFAWPPLLDWIVKEIDAPLTSFVSWLAEPLAGLGGVEVARYGTAFTVGKGAGAVSLTVSSACSGLASVFAFLLVGGALVLVLRGSREAKLTWLATGLVLVLAANVVRIAAVLAVAGRFGIATAFDVFHYTTGAVLFLAAFALMLFLLDRFRLELRLPARAEIGPLHLTRGGFLFRLGFIGLLAAALAVLVASSGFRAPGVYFGAPALTRTATLPLPDGYARNSDTSLPFVANLFGAGSYAHLIEFSGPGNRGYSAQVVITPSYRHASRYGVLDCFVFHRVEVLSARRVSIGGGGTALLSAINLEGRDLGSISWLQPVLFDGHRSWRRVVLYGNLIERAPAETTHRSLIGSFSVWLLNRISPYGRPRSPARFRQTESDLIALAGALAGTPALKSQARES